MKIKERGQRLTALPFGWMIKWYGAPAWLKVMRSTKEHHRLGRYVAWFKLIAAPVVSVDGEEESVDFIIQPDDRIEVYYDGAWFLTDGKALYETVTRCGGYRVPKE